MNRYGVPRAAYNRPNPNLRIGAEKVSEPRLKFVTNDSLRLASYRPITEQVLRMIASQQPGGVSPVTVACNLMKGDNYTVFSDVRGERTEFVVYLD